MNDAPRRLRAMPDIIRIEFDTWGNPSPFCPLIVR
jgi:hypothetical protein